MLPVEAFMAFGTISMPPVTVPVSMIISVPVNRWTPVAACPHPVVVAPSPAPTDPDVTRHRASRRHLYYRSRHWRRYDDWSRRHRRTSSSLEQRAVRPRIRANLPRIREACARLNLTPMNLTTTRPVIPRENILLIEGIYDLICPKDDIEDLWHSWGQPDIGEIAGAIAVAPRDQHFPIG